MGCGPSSEDGDRDEKRRASKNDTESKTGTLAAAAAKYAESASPVTSEVEILLEEMGRRVPSRCSSSSGDEPSEAVKAMRFKAAVTRGKVVNGMNEDPDQFKDQMDVPEFKRRDRRRVDEWTKLVAAAVAADGPEQIPEGTFLLTPSFSVAFTTSSSVNVVSTNASDGKPLEAPGRQRSSGGSNTHEFVVVEDSTTESFSARRENSSIDHVDSGDILSRNDTTGGGSARAALQRMMQQQQQKSPHIQQQQRTHTPPPGTVLLPISAAGAADVVSIEGGTRKDPPRTPDQQSPQDGCLREQQKQQQPPPTDPRTELALLDQPFVLG